MLAGAQLDGGDASGAEDARPEWSEVIAGRWLSSKLDALRSPELRAEIDANAGLEAELRPYQKLGVQWLWTLRGLGLGGCLADDMGLGKTIQVLGVLSMSRRQKGDEKKEGSDLLVVPASLVDNWRLEIERFAPELKVLIAHPSHIPSSELKKVLKKKVDAHDAVITTYGTAMRTEWMKSHAWQTVILDEAQAIKNPAAKQTKAVKALHSQWRLALTGTPVENRLGDLWSIFDFLNPGLLGSAKAFNGLCKSMASVKLSPVPPALSESTMNGIRSSSWKLLTSPWRFLTGVPPCNTRPLRPKTSPRTAASGAVISRNWVNTRTLSWRVAIDSQSSRSRKSFPLSAGS